MTTKDILAELDAYGSEQTKSTLMRHGAKEPVLVLRFKIK
jgi:hypothetical protein